MPSIKGQQTWRFLPNPTFIANNETFFGVSNEASLENFTMPDPEPAPVPD